MIWGFLYLQGILFLGKCYGLSELEAFFLKSFVLFFSNSWTKVTDSNCHFILFIKFLILSRFLHKVVTANLHLVPIITDIKIIHIMSLISNYMGYT